MVAPHKSFQLRKFPPQVAAQHPYQHNIFLVIQSNRGFSGQHISRTPSGYFQRQRSGNSSCALFWTFGGPGARRPLRVNRPA